MWYLHRCQADECGYGGGLNKTEASPSSTTVGTPVYPTMITVLVEGIRRRFCHQRSEYLSQHNTNMYLLLPFQFSYLGAVCVWRKFAYSWLSENCNCICKDGSTSMDTVD
ncbi:hypothetical protein ACFX11_027156 [Malus domestica]